MKLEIDIDEDYYKIICKRVQDNKPFHSPYEYEVIADGKPLEQEPTTKNDLGVDCISRADAIKAMQNKAKELKNEDTINGLCGAVAILYEMPPIIPIRPKGHWEPGRKLSLAFEGATLKEIIYEDWHCSNCHCVVEESIKPKWNYCPNCGSDNREVQK